MQVRFFANAGRLLYGSDENFARLLVYRREPDEESEQMRQRCIGRVEVAPPRPEWAARPGQPAAVGRGRLRLLLNASASDDEKKEILDLAEKRMRVLDRIWFLHAANRLNEDFLRAAALFQDMKELPPHFDVVPILEAAPKIAYQIRRLQQQSYRQSPTAERWQHLGRHPARQLAWAYADAEEELPRRIEEQLLRANPRRWQTDENRELSPAEVRARLRADLEEALENAKSAKKKPRKSKT